MLEKKGKRKKERRKKEKKNIYHVRYNTHGWTLYIAVKHTIRLSARQEVRQQGFQSYLRHLLFAAVAITIYLMKLNCLDIAIFRYVWPGV